MIRVFGCSDDLIEVRGDVDEEFGAYSNDDEGHLLGASDGTVLALRYGEHDACWRITRLVEGSAAYSVVQVGDDDRSEKGPDGAPPYSDVVQLDGDIRWVLLARKGKFAKARRKTPLVAP